MATCKDCLHVGVCYMVEHYGVDETEDGCARYKPMNSCPNGVTVQEWISVKDRLPEKHQNVLTVRTIAGNERIEFDFISSKGEWYGDTFFKGSPVTYWFPFPQPPKGE